MNSSESRRPRTKQAMILFFSGIVLCAGSCAGAFASAGARGWVGVLSNLAVIGFMVGLAMVIATAILLIIEGLS